MVLVDEEIGIRSVVLVGTVAGSAEAGTEGTRMAELGTAEVGIVELFCGDELVGISVKGGKEVRSGLGEAVEEV